MPRFYSRLNATVTNDRGRIAVQAPRRRRLGVRYASPPRTTPGGQRCGSKRNLRLVSQPRLIPTAPRRRCSSSAADALPQVLTPLAVPPSETEPRLGKKARRYAEVGAPFTRSGGGLAHSRRECGGARAALGPDRCRAPYESESVGVRGTFKLGKEENVPAKV